MSRIGKLPINVPAGVTISVQDTLVTVKGPKGVLTQEIDPHITVTIEDGICQVSRHDDEKQNMHSTACIVR